MSTVRDGYEDSDDDGVCNGDERCGSRERHSDRDHPGRDRGAPDSRRRPDSPVRKP